jgi:hypothetical protein
MRSTATRLVVIPFCAVFLAAWATRAQAEEYQDQIAKAFPGFEILTRSDFTADIQQIVKTNPALTTGHFNGDKLEDFAAIILNRPTQYGQQGEKKYYLGKHVVCHGAEEGRYQCQVLKEERMHLPYDSYLRRVRPRKLKCITDKHLAVAEISLQRDSIGWASPDQGAGVYVFQSDGTYRECIHPFD